MKFHNFQSSFEFMRLFICVCLSVSIVYASLADGVAEEANNDLGGQDEFGGEYHELDVDDPNCQQEMSRTSMEERRWIDGIKRSS